MRNFKKTPKQIEAIDKMAKCKELLLEGGSRSGKTFIIVYAIFVRALKHPNTDHLSVRAKLVDAMGALWEKTIPDVNRICFPNVKLKQDKQYHFLTFPNGSRYWIGGLDNKERMEKVLGNEYATIHENEITQASYKSHVLMRTRLNPPIGVKPLMLLDQNPASKRHWGYKLFHSNLDPLTDEPINYSDKLDIIKMNPFDNKTNLNETYFETLDTMSGNDRKRFLNGEYTEVEGVIYDLFNEKMITDKEPDCDEYICGVDLITYAAVLIGICGEDVIILDELGGKNLTASELNALMVERWGKYQYRAYIDWNLSETGTREFENSTMATKGAGSVEAGINQIRTLMEQGHFYLHERCSRTRLEIEEYHRDDNGKIVKENDHYIDGMRYGIYSHLSTGTPHIWVV